MNPGPSKPRHGGVKPNSLLLKGPWRWARFGKPGPTLVTAHSGALIILDTTEGRLMTRGDDGFLHPVTGNEPVLQLIESAPSLLDALETISFRLDYQLREMTRYEALRPVVESIRSDLDRVKALISKTRGEG